MNYNQINFDRFYFGFNYFKNLLKNHNTKVICSIWDNIGLKEIKNAYKPGICSTHNQNDFQKNFEDDCDKTAAFNGKSQARIELFIHLINIKL